MSKKSVLRYKKLLTTQVKEKLHAVLLTSTQNILLWTTPRTFEPQERNRLKELRVRSGLHSRKVELSPLKYFHAFVSTLNYVSPIGANSDWIHQLNSKNNGSVSCYLRLYFGNDNVCRRLLQWIARIKNGLKLTPTTRYRTCSNQISTRLIPIRWWKCRIRWLWSSLWQDMQDHVGKISTRPWLVRLDLWGWCRFDGYIRLVYSVTNKLY